VIAVLNGDSRDFLKRFLGKTVVAHGVRGKTSTGKLTEVSYSQAMLDDDVVVVRLNVFAWEVIDEEEKTP
jgi:small nuclear ribonucleoprotein (snRNP)-like protein